MTTMSKEAKQNEQVITPMAPRNKANKTPYMRKRKGLPLPEGYTFQDLSKEQRDEYFLQAENAWKRD
jgi:hypothetical protein